MSRSANLISVGRSLLETNGESITFTRVVEGTYDPLTDTFSGGSSSNFSVYCVPTQYNKDEIDETVVLSSDIRLIIAKPSSTTPLVGDECSVNSLDYRVEAIKTIRLEGSDIIYIAQLRRQ